MQYSFDPLGNGQGSIDFVTGGCGFVGRHLVKRLLSQGRSVLIVDDLSTGRHPSTWLGGHRLAIDLPARLEAFLVNGKQTVLFAHSDLIPWLLQRWEPLRDMHIRFGDVFHLASVVGGRATIDGDPLAVGIDLGIDAVFFRWLARNHERIGRVLYASSSAAYPVSFQGQDGAVALSEDMIEFGGSLGQPD
ncbi:MAG TPA: NAD-dependent epimerase/dehydratase family protein, partial [Candidatus Limnocylindrales bacterium]